MKLKNIMLNSFWYEIHSEAGFEITAVNSEEIREIPEMDSWANTQKAT